MLRWKKIEKDWPQSWMSLQPWCSSWLAWCWRTAWLNYPGRFLGSPWKNFNVLTRSVYDWKDERISMNMLPLLRWKSASVRVIFCQSHFISIQVCPGLQPSLFSFREAEMWSWWHPRLSQCFQCCASSLRWCLNLGQSEFSNILRWNLKGTPGTKVLSL